MVLLNAVKTKYAIFTFLWLEYLWKLYLIFRQYRLCKKSKDVPSNVQEIMSRLEFYKARIHALHCLKYNFIKNTFAVLISTMVIKTGFLSTIWTYSELIIPWQGEAAINGVWLFILITLWTLIDLPFAAYGTFILDKKCNFSKNALKAFFLDKIQIFLIRQTLGCLITPTSTVLVTHGGRMFYVWLWLAEAIIFFIIYLIYPSYIAPYFGSYATLPEGELRNEITNLALEMDFPLGQIYVVERCKRIPHNNAYLSGMFGEKHMIFFDTLFAKPDASGCNKDEVLAILAHELGHWINGHVVKLLILDQVDFLLQILVFAYMLHSTPIYIAVGFPPNLEPTVVGLVVVTQYIMMPYNAFTLYLFNCVSRNFEFEADEFVIMYGKAKSLKSALIKLNKSNLEFPIYDPLYSAWLDSHPPLLQRLEALEPHLRNS